MVGLELPLEVLLIIDSIMKITLNIFNYKMESWKSEEKIEILSPETKINFAILLGTFLDCPSIPPPPENQISLL